MAIRSRDTAPHGALLTQRALQQTFPIAKALFGFIFFLTSITTGAAIAGRLYTFMYLLPAPFWVYSVGVVVSLILGAGQYYTRAMQLRWTYLAFVFPDALTTTWMLCQWVIFDLWAILLPGIGGQICATIMGGVWGLASAIIPERVWVQR